MLNFIMFIISFFGVITSSYFICSLVKSKKPANTLIFYILILISQIIITFEILSILKQVNSTGVLFLNFVVFLVSFIFWNYFKRPFIDISEFKYLKIKIERALKKDKILRILFIFFIFSSLISLFLALISPTNSADSLSYHLARIGFWIQNGTMSHYETSLIRQLIFPINSEILILWSMVFLKSDYLAQIPEYLSYIGCLFILFSFLSYLKISTRRILWTIFILASFPAVILESMSCQTNLIIAFLLMSSLYLFIFGVKENDKKSLIFSAVSYSIALGTKNTAFLFLPAFGIVYCLISFNALKHNFYKPLLIFFISVIPAFILLGSYNFFLNYIDFGSPFSPPSFMHLHNPEISLKGFITNIIKYLIIFLDFSGIKSAQILNPLIMGFKDNLFYILGLKTSDGLAFYDLSQINTFIHENYSMYGILGFILFLPLVIKTGIIKRFSKNRSFIVGLTGFIFIGFLLTISAAMGFCFWFNRFFLTAVILSSPVLIFSYSRKNQIRKIFIALIAVSNFMVISTCNASKPFLPILMTLPNNNITELRNEIRLRDEFNIQQKTYIYNLVKYFGKFVPDHSKIAFISSTEEYFYPLFEENHTWKIYPLRYDLLFKRKNYNDYDFIILPNIEQNIVVPYKGKIKYNYSMVGNKIIFDKNNDNDLITIYRNTTEKPTNSGIPTTMLFLIDLSDVPSNFKLVKTYNIFIKTSKLNTKYTYYVYKKIN